MSAHTHHPLLFAIVLTLPGSLLQTSSADVLPVSPHGDIPDVHAPAVFSPGLLPTLAGSADLIRLTEARNLYPQITGAGYTVAVIDTGVDATHPALAGRYTNGWDYVNNTSYQDDDNGHGTHVAGIVASSDPIYPGVAPGAHISSLKVLDAYGSGYFSDVELALQWVLSRVDSHHIAAVNLSLGTATVYQSPATSFLSDEFAALRDAGVFVATAAGNGYGDNHSTGGGVGYPAADPTTVSVGSVWTGNFGGVSWSGGATDYTSDADRIVSHSDRHPDMLDLLAPGAWITSTSANWETGSDWVTYAGTSMATPAAAGLATLIRQAIDEHWNPAIRPADADLVPLILNVMQSTGTPVYDGDDEDDNVTNLGKEFPRIDVAAALKAVMPPAGDADRDLDVDSADLALIGANWDPYSMVLRREDGDFDADGDIDAVDLAQIGMNWGQSSAAFQFVPEPSSAVLIGMGMYLLLAPHRPRNRTGHVTGQTQRRPKAGV